MESEAREMSGIELMTTIIAAAIGATIGNLAGEALWKLYQRFGGTDEQE